MGQGWEMTAKGQTRDLLGEHTARVHWAASRARGYLPLYACVPNPEHQHWTVDEVVQLQLVEG